MSKYLCWNCELWQGDEQDDLESSKLCPSCTAARDKTVREWEQSVKDTTEERRIA